MVSTARQTSQLQRARACETQPAVVPIVFVGERQLGHAALAPNVQRALFINYSAVTQPRRGCDHHALPRRRHNQQQSTAGAVTSSNQRLVQLPTAINGCRCLTLDKLGTTVGVGATEGSSVSAISNPSRPKVALPQAYNRPSVSMASVCLVEPLVPHAHKRR